MKRPLGLLMLLLAVLLVFPHPAFASGSHQDTSKLPVCEPSPFRVIDRYFFSPDFDQDQVVFLIAVRPDEVGWKLYRSTDGGRTWSFNLNENIYALSFSPNYSQDHTIFAAPYTREIPEPYFLRSTDRGVTWQRLFTPSDGPWVSSFSTLAVAGPDSIFYGRSGYPGASDPMARGLFHFTFGPTGVTWEQLRTRNASEVSLSPNFPHDHTLFVGEYGYKINYGLFKSIDGGHTWTASNTGLDLSPGTDGSASAESILFAPGFPADSVMFVAMISQYYRSTNQGSSWQRVDPFPIRYPTPFYDGHWVLSPDFERDRMAWIEHGEWLTRDAGDTWEHVGLTQVMNLAAREWCEGERCGVLLLGGGSSHDARIGVYKSFDLGRTWQCPDAPTPA